MSYNSIDEVKNRLEEYKTQCVILNSLKNRLKQKTEQVFALQNFALSDMPRGNESTSNKLTELLSDKIELELKVRNQAEKTELTKIQVQDLISLLEDEKAERILSRKYISFRTTKEIAQELFYSESYIFKVCKKAFYTIMEKVI